MVIDSHTHINSMVLNKEEQERERKRIQESRKIEYAINVGLNIETSKEAIALAKEERKLYATAGIHPLYTEGESLKELYELAKKPKVVAIGEIGLDDSKPNFIEQKKALIRQIMIANEFCLPVIIHSSNSNKMVKEIFEKYVKPQYGCVFHCFQPDMDMLEYLIEKGYYISFAGKVTYPNAKRSLEVARRVPEELFMVETDSPFLSPEPVREEKNSSTNIKYIVERLAEVRETTPEEIMEQTRANTKRLFKKIS